MPRTSSATSAAQAEPVAGQPPSEASEAEQILGLGKVSQAWMVGGADYLPYRILLLAKLLDRCTNRILTEMAGLSIAEWRVLAQLALSSPQSVRQLAEQAWVDRAEVSRAAAALERRGCVERRENPKDRRSPMLFCSKKGRVLFDKVAPSRREFQRQMRARLTDTQAKELDDALLVLARHCVVELDSERPGRQRRPKG